MDAKQGRACDFRLVSTYVPFVTTIVRAQLFIGVVSVAGPELPAQVYAAVLLFVVYFDALLHAGVCTSSIGGHLVPMCFVWLTRPPASQPALEIQDAQLALDVAWLAVVQALVASYTFRRKVPVAVVPILAVNAAFVLCRLWLAAAPGSAVEMHVRSVCFYVFVFTHFHVFQTRSQWDVAAHACLGPHVAMHVFFVDAWFVAISMGCTVFMCVRVYLQGQDHHDTENAPVPTHDRRTPVDAFVDVEDMAELMQQLLAAKAGALEA
jgi:hypothetical protein